MFPGLTRQHDEFSHAHVTKIYGALKNVGRVVLPWIRRRPQHTDAARRGDARADQSLFKVSDEERGRKDRHDSDGQADTDKLPNGGRESFAADESEPQHGRHRARHERIGPEVQTN